jgi:hypothetical protein
MSEETALHTQTHHQPPATWTDRLHLIGPGLMIGLFQK